MARRGQRELARIVERIRASPVVHADKTGWRQEGGNGCVWTFGTPSQRYFLRWARNKEVVDEALGEGFAGVKGLFVLVAEPETPVDNNAAERTLRPLVISRKTSGGGRSVQGGESKMALASIFGTWRSQGLNPLQACRQLLLCPQL